MVPKWNFLIEKTYFAILPLLIKSFLLLFAPDGDFLEGFDAFVCWAAVLISKTFWILKIAHKFLLFWLESNFGRLKLHLSSLVSLNSLHFCSKSKSQYFSVSADSVVGKEIGLKNYNVVTLIHLPNISWAPLILYWSISLSFATIISLSSFNFNSCSKTYFTSGLEKPTEN